MGKFLCILSKKKSENGNQQIFIRVNISRSNRPTIKSGVYVKSEWWNGEIKIPQKGKLNFSERNEALRAKSSLDIFISRLEKIINETEANAPERLNKEWIENANRVIKESGIATEEVTYNKISELIAEDVEEEKEIKKLPFFECFDLYIENHIGVKRRKDHLRVVEMALKRCELFVGSIFDLDTFNSDKLRKFRDFLGEEHTFFEDKKGVKVCKKKYLYIYNKVENERIPEKRGKNYIIGMFKIVRAFFKWANKEGYTQNDPFKFFSITKEIGNEVYGTPFFLTIEERNKLYNFDFSNFPAIAKQRDVFVFQCCVGCRVGDLRRLKKTNIVKQGDMLFLNYVPNKTKNKTNKVAEVPLNKIAAEIVDRYKDEKGKYLLPTIAEQNYNDYIKVMLEMAEINRVVTVLNSRTREEVQKPLYEVASSHMARRTFIGNLYKKTPDPNIIGSMSGHVEGSRAFQRYREIDKDLKIKFILKAEEEE